MKYTSGMNNIGHDYGLQLLNYVTVHVLPRDVSCTFLLMVTLECVIVCEIVSARAYVPYTVVF